MDRKIDEELEFEARKSDEPVSTGAHLSEPVPTDNMAEKLAEPAEDPSEPVPTSRNQASAAGGVEDELRAQLKHTQQEVLFLRDELKHRRKTDEALGSVIEAFRLNSETTKARMLDVHSESDRQSREGKPSQDIVQNEDERMSE